MKRRNIVLVSVLIVISLAILALYLSAWSPVTLAAMVINTFRSARSPHGTLVTNLAKLQRHPTQEAGRATTGPSLRNDSRR